MDRRGTRVVGAPSRRTKKGKILVGAWFSATGRREGARSSFYDVTWLDDTRPLAYSSFCARQKLSLSLALPLPSFLSSDFENRNIPVLCALRSLYFVDRSVAIFGKGSGYKEVEQGQNAWDSGGQNLIVEVTSISYRAT